MGLSMLARCGRAAGAAGLVALLGADAGAQARDEKRQLEDAQRAEAQELVALVERAAEGQPPDAGLSLRWGRHYFIKAQGDKTYVPFTVVLQPEPVANPAVGLYLRVVSTAQPAPPPPAEAKPAEAPTGGEFAFEDLYFFDLPAAPAGQPRRLSRAFAVSPGEYDVYVALKERTTSAPEASPLRSAVVRESMTVPDFSAPGLKASTVIVAQRIDMLESPIDPEAQAEHPFTFGQMQIVPAPELQFSKKDELTVVFWIYGAENDPATKKPNVQIEYRFHRIEGEAQTYFNKTEPQLLNAETLPPQFDLAAGHQLSGSLAVGLTSFPEGTYRLDIEVQDKAAGTRVTPDVQFTVAP